MRRPSPGWGPPGRATQGPRSSHIFKGAVRLAALIVFLWVRLAGAPTSGEVWRFITPTIPPGGTAPGHGQSGQRGALSGSASCGKGSWAGAA